MFVVLVDVMSVALVTPAAPVIPAAPVTPAASAPAHLIATYCQYSLAKEVAREARTCAPIPASTTGRRPKRSAAKPATRLNRVTYEKDGT